MPLKKVGKMKLDPAELIFKRHTGKSELNFASKEGGRERLGHEGAPLHCEAEYLNQSINLMNS